MPRISRFKKKSSDRSGFDYFEIGLVKEGPWKVAPEERDVLPPSKIRLGGEGDLNPGEARDADEFTIANTAIPTELENPTVFLTAAGGITASFTHPWMRVTGSNAAIAITAIPQITRGQQGQLLTLQCVDSSITLAHGSANAVNLMGSSGTIRLQSGGILTLIFNTANQAWSETSRGYL